MQSSWLVLAAVVAPAEVVGEVASVVAGGAVFAAFVGD
jgi:hypothetical protein